MPEKAQPLPLAGEGAEEGKAFRWGRGSKHSANYIGAQPLPLAPYKF